MGIGVSFICSNRPYDMGAKYTKLNGGYSQDDPHSVLTSACAVQTSSLLLRIPRQCHLSAVYVRLSAVGIVLVCLRDTANSEQTPQQLFVAGS